MPSAFGSLRPMSWNCLFIVVRTAQITDFAAIGVEPLGEPLTADDVARQDFAGVAAVQHGADVVLINSDQSLMTAGPLLAGLLHREVVTALFSGVADSYLWRVDGPSAERSLVWQAGETIAETGLALPEERYIDALDEDGLFQLLAARTDFGRSDWLHLSAQPVTWPPTGPEAKAKRRWLRRE